MTNISDLFPPVPTYNPSDSGLQFEYNVPIGDGLSGYTWYPETEFQDQVIKADGMQIDSSGGWNRTATGFAYSNAAYNILVRDLANLPANTMNIRRYTLEWAQYAASVAGTNDGLNFIFNYVDSLNFNFFQIVWTGSVYTARYTERVAGSDTTRITLNMSSIIDEPVYGYMMLEDWGDNVMLTVAGFETDNASSDYGSYRAIYTGSPRPNKTGLGFYAGMGAVTTPGRFGIRAVRIQDIG